MTDATPLRAFLDGMRDERPLSDDHQLWPDIMRLLRSTPTRLGLAVENRWVNDTTRGNEYVLLDLDNGALPVFRCTNVRALLDELLYR